MPSALEKIVEAAEIQKTDTVLEIGPGLGSLTRYLSISAHQVVAVELDLKLVSVLHTILKPYANVRLIHGDILDLTPKELGLPADYLVAANIPYNITSAIIRHLLEIRAKTATDCSHRSKRSRGTDLRQAAGYESAGVERSSLWNAAYHGTHSCGGFFPRTKSRFSSCKIEILPAPSLNSLLPIFLSTDQSRLQPEKKNLRNSLSAGLKISTTEAESLLAKAEIDLKRRAETLSLDEWDKLNRIYSEIEKQ